MTDVVKSITPVDPMSGVIDLSKWLAGTQTGTTGTDTSTTTGATGPLSDLLTQISDPQNLQNLVGSLFNQAALQVPSLTAQFANATGSRVAGNSPLASSLAMLNTNLAQAIAQSVVDQQKTAVAAAGKLADVNKTVATTGNKTATTQPASLTKALAIPAGGLALNAADKMGLLGTAKKAITNKISGAPVADTGPVSDAGTTFPAFSVGTSSPPDFTGISAPINAGNADVLGGLDPSLVSGVSQGVNLGSDLSLGGNTASAVGDAANLADTTVSGLPPVADTAGIDLSIPQAGAGDITGSTDIADFFSSLFADGGKVRKGYADAGLVRGITNLGDPLAVASTPVLNVDPSKQLSADASAGAGGGGTEVAAGTQTPLTLLQLANKNAGGPSGAVDMEDGSDATAPEGMPDVGQSISVATALGMVANAMMGNFPAVAIAIANAIANNAEVGNAANDAATGVAASTPGSVDATDAGSVGNAAGGSAAAATASADPGTSDAGSPGNAAGGSADAADAAAAGTGDAAPGGDAGGAAGDAGGDGGGAGGAEADGGNNRIRGLVKGRGTSTSDSIPVNLSNNEYVLPASVVDVVGKDVLDELVASLHTPARTGTHG